MKVVTAILTIIISFCLSEDMSAQSFEAVLFAKVQREEVDGKIIFESTSDRGGQYENVNLYIIDNDVVLRFEYGEADAAGFIIEEKSKSIMFKLTNLKSYFSGNTCDWYGYAINKNLDNGKPFDFRLHLGDNGYMTVSVGKNVKYCYDKDVQNYNILLLDNYSQQLSSPQSTNNQGKSSTSTKSSKTSPKKSTKPPLRK